jgi:hypothetical protein
MSARRTAASAKGESHEHDHGTQSIHRGILPGREIGNLS